MRALRLNPDDNQGNRYLLVNWLLESGREDEAAKLLARYPDDASASWAWSAALLAFRRGGAANAAAALADARRANAHVPAYLLGRKKLPLRLPDGFGDESEAVSYAAEAAGAWKATPSAIEWLERQTGRKRPAKVRYEADQDVDETMWLAMSEEKRLAAVRAAHRNPPTSPPPMMSPEGHVTMHVVVENQLASGEPSQARAALGRLRAAGLGRHEAIHAIASVLVRHLHGLVRGSPVEEDLYEAELDALTAEGWNGSRH